MRLGKRSKPASWLPFRVRLGPVVYKNSDRADSYGVEGVLTRDNLRIVMEAGCRAKEVMRTGMSVDFQGFTQIQSVDGFTVPSLGLSARRLAESAAVGGDTLISSSESYLSCVTMLGFSVGVDCD